ncbi:MAG: hypothetical protein FJW23_02930 [Acidimicrobiia bacterium]|nr:hypothetical protein [Acidimicrobiia bacterium]
MKILFVARHFTYLRNFDSVLSALAERGHHVHVAVEQDETFGGTDLMGRLVRQYPDRITAGPAAQPKGRWYTLAVRLRFGVDYLRYLEPAYAEMPRLRLRSRVRAPVAVVRLTDRWPFRTGPLRRALARLLSAIERTLPRSPEVRSFLEAQAPDVVLFTPLIGVVASPQLDHLYAAQTLGLPTALAVWSWDHLSSKAIIRTVPDRVIVWNPTQQEEAVRLHGVPPSRVVVTGAQCFDRWFDREPSRPRAGFARRVGLPDDRPYLLWVCSALFKGSPPEAGFVMRWIRELRASGHPELADVPILVRPHPSRLAEWQDVDVSREPGVALWGSNPIDADARADYFDSLFHCAAVVGLNTSAFIEGAIAGRPTYTILLPEYFENQEGTLHFHYLLDGLLHASRSFTDHAAQLAAAVRGEGDADRSRRFVEQFVRPHGRSTAATPRFVDAVEALPGVERSAAAPVGLLTRLATRAFVAATWTKTGWLLMYDEAGAAKEKRREAERAATGRGGKATAA